VRGLRGGGRPARSRWKHPTGGSSPGRRRKDRRRGNGVRRGDSVASSL
ncbi:MAG: hypothetical protein AVDCRST_MAG01-01-543, partial [uncultured Rubrobacteraceae bacterium]